MEILETVPTYIPYGWYLVLMTLIFASILGFIVAAHYGENWAAPVSGILALIFAVMLILGIDGVFSYRNEEKDNYIVRLSDELSINDFSREWKIVEHDKYTDVYKVQKR